MTTTITGTPILTDTSVPKVGDKRTIAVADLAAVADVQVSEHLKLTSTAADGTAKVLWEADQTVVQPQAIGVGLSKLEIDGVAVPITVSADGKSLDYMVPKKATS